MAGGNNNQTSSMATNTLQHPSHEHPLVPRDLSCDSIAPPCHLCHRKILAEAYTCQGECKSYNYHRACAEAPPQIDLHPLHPIHPLSLILRQRPFFCDACGKNFCFDSFSFACIECDYDLDISCALSTLSDRGGSPGGKTPKQITLPVHPHPLTSFSTRHDFVKDSDCMLCLVYVERDGYMCLHRRCKSLVHKRCIQDLYYADGTKAPQVYHGHQLETFVVEDTGSSRCANCGSEDASGEFIGCASCEVFIHRDCIQVPEILQYPHHPDHTLILFLNSPDQHELQCRSCSSYLGGELSYHCTSCNFFLHVLCALKTLAYWKEGMTLKCKGNCHEHPLLLCHRTGRCFYCGDESTGSMYACEEQDCGFLLHPQCIVGESTKIHPHHPEHRLTLRMETDGPSPLCEACRGEIFGSLFSCKLCAFYLHLECIAHVPTRKHCLHEHELLRLDKVLSLECNLCGASTDSPFFRCVPCNFNLHEKCMDLPQVVNSEVHWHPLTLHESYVEDDSGEYYCDHCEKSRDVRLGAYVCGQCTARWAYHIECVLLELQKVFAKTSKTSVMKRLAEQIARKNEEVCATEEKLEEMKRELDEMMKKQAELTSEEG